MTNYFSNLTRYGLFPAKHRPLPARHRPRRAVGHRLHHGGVPERSARQPLSPDAASRQLLVHPLAGACARRIPTALHRLGTGRIPLGLLARRAREGRHGGDALPRRMAHLRTRPRNGLGGVVGGIPRREHRPPRGGRLLFAEDAAAAHRPQRRHRELLSGDHPLGRGGAQRLPAARHGHRASPAGFGSSNATTCNPSTTRSSRRSPAPAK